MTASTAFSTSHKKGLVMPAAKEHARFFEQYYDAAKTSQPDAYFKAALLAKQWEQAIIAELHAAAELALPADAEIAEQKQTLTHMAGHVADLSAMVDGQSAEIAELRAYIEVLKSMLKVHREHDLRCSLAALATPLEAQS